MAAMSRAILPTSQALLLDLLPLRKTCAEARIPLPAKLHAAIERMLPMLRFFTHGDGGIAMFQGAGDTLADSCRAIFSADPVAGRPVTHASHSGYVRLAAGAVTAIADAGLPAPDAVNRRAALSPLAFEFSDDGHRLVINCGSPPVRQPRGHGRRAPARSAQHRHARTPRRPPLPGRSSRWLGRLGLVTARTAPGQVEARIETSPVGIAVRRPPRCLSGARPATCIRAACSCRPKAMICAAKTVSCSAAPASGANVPFTVRFHLHPAVKATLSKDRKSIMLRAAEQGRLAVFRPRRHSWS